RVSARTTPLARTTVAMTTAATIHCRALRRGEVGGAAGTSGAHDAAPGCGGITGAAGSIGGLGGPSSDIRAGWTMASLQTSHLLDGREAVRHAAGTQHGHGARAGHARRCRENQDTPGVGGGVSAPRRTARPGAAARTRASRRWALPATLARD